jgi:hypothetical protein
MKMNRTKIKTFAKVFGVLLVISTLTVFLGQGCGSSYEAASTGSNLGNNQCVSQSGEIIDKNFEVLPNTQTVSISYGQQLLDSFVSCTGVVTPSQRTVDEWTRRNQSLSEYGSLTDISGAMMMAVAAVAAETCQDLINKETPLSSATRGIFRDVNLSGTGLSTAEITSAAQMLALSCWQRPATAAEQTDLVNTIGALSASSTNGALGLCTAMLSSFAAISQ